MYGNINPWFKMKEKNQDLKEFSCAFAVSGEIVIKAKDENNAREKFFTWYEKNVREIEKLNNEFLNKFDWLKGDHSSSDILFDIFEL